ncbi:Gfo/Idh/MocA family oxidoreductase [Aliifodinibius sp. S!AR15-10]|uniref:Gfo/Idh/MocA family protein n=1 Tax=Aliifodinibius sp. S!AR15-10 TaxID=2950437 RepID=UPI0028647F7D|nr:Gfo/Idh/MocA family oxidoreductase [Aliifodinibius sp. S!AR15-10]MDR8390082.1 Gfo/Idh/MocA family oxidoreductase [Aliifodinibius sp. S!AR15-10]
MDETGKGKTRRDFIKKLALGGAGFSLGLSAKSYGNILGSNEQLNVAVMGLNGRGKAHMRAVQDTEYMNLSYLCDVDSRVLQEAAAIANDDFGVQPETVTDFRKLLENDDVDAITIATPDHWHAPMTLMAVDAGKHVYVEKPCSHNPREGELLIEAQEKYGKVIQMGNQQRSGPTSIQAVKDIREGIIGRAYFGKAWYSNSRGPIGDAKSAPVPSYLDWELWQGPAPHQEYEDIWVHYNWHWHWNWGTGEINNNGTHEIDICRWALGVDYPTKVTSAGGRYHYDDAWQFYDTQDASFEFEGDKMITWEGKSCNPFEYHDRGRGATIHGTEGTVLMDRNGYMAWDLDGNMIKEMKEDEKSATTDTVGAGNLDLLHMQNFVAAIRTGEEQHSPIDEGHKSNLLCHLGNIAQENGGSLQVNPKTGKIIDNPEAMKMWSREYESGWKPTV